MKKILVVFLISIICLGTVGCSKRTNEITSEENSKEESTQKENTREDSTQGESALESKSVMEETVTKDLFSIISVEFEEPDYPSEYYDVVFTIRNDSQEVLTYCYIGIRTLNNKNVVKDDFNSWNQRSIVTELEPGQAVEQSLGFKYADEIKTIEVDTYGYKDANENQIEEKFAEKIKIDVPQNTGSEEANSKPEESATKVEEETALPPSEDKINSFIENLWKYESLSDLDTLAKEVEYYYDYLTDEEKADCLAQLAVCDMQDLLKKVIKKDMKDPNSFEWRAFDVGNFPTHTEDSKTEYSTTVRCTFAGKNSFGAYDTESLNGLVSFRVDIDKKTYYITDTFFM